MAFQVRTFVSEDAIQAVVGGTVVTYPDEQTFSDAINAATDPKFFVVKQLKFTLFDETTLINIQSIDNKGGFFTLTDGTP